MQKFDGQKGYSYVSHHVVKSVYYNHKLIFSGSWRIVRLLLFLYPTLDADHERKHNFD